MWTALVSVLLSVTPGPVEAQAFAQKQAWDELYLAFAAARPEAHTEKDRARIATALLKGCEALRSKDAVLAVSLGEGAYRFDPSAGAALCQARSALASSQRSLAETSLREAHARFPADAALALMLGTFLHEERAFEEAIEVLGRVPKRAREAAAAKRLITQAKRGVAEASAARAEAETLERRVARGEPTQTGRGGGTGNSGDTQPAGYRSAGSGQLGGMRTRTHGEFSIRYFNNERDFGQRADYEGRIAEALDDASGFTRRILGFARERPVEVILYTRDEFRAHMGERAARSVAGLYSMDAIRINDAAELTQQTRAVLTHEYVHAVVDELADGRTSNVPIWLNEGLAEYVEWRYLGSEEAPYSTRVSLRGAALADRLPRLSALAAGALSNSSDPHLSYAVSALAVRRMMQVGGGSALRALVRDVGAGQPFAAALQRHFNLTVEALDAEVASAAAER